MKYPAKKRPPSIHLKVSANQARHLSLNDTFRIQTLEGARTDPQIPLQT